MSRKRPLTQAELEAMAEHLSDEDYCDSEFDGDDDPEDDLPLDTPSVSSRDSSFSTSPTFENQQATASSVNLRKKVLMKSYQVESDSDECDDSDADPDFYPDTMNTISRMFASRTDSTSEVEEVNESLIDNNNCDNNDKRKRTDIPENSFSWSKKTEPNLKFDSFHFDEVSEVKINVTSQKPIDYFRVYFDESICRKIIEESNLYAQQKNAQLDLDSEELDAFLGILIVMGFHKLPTMRSYWSRDDNFHVERVSKVFTLKRFLKVLRYLHLNDNAKMAQPKTSNFDRLYKLRPMLDHLARAFHDSFIPQRNLSIDESMCAFKGRTTLKQYMPMKPIKRGFKIWTLACASTGYLINFQIYQGKVEAANDMLGERVGLELSEKFRNRGYCIYFDNFFTTFPLMQKLLDVNLFGCGTLRQNRKGFSKHLLTADKHISRNQSDSVASGDISLYKWKDRGVKCVTLTSNMHNYRKETHVLRTNKTGDRENVPCPESIADYNKYMGGVDLFNQYHANYSISWKSRRWWIKIFYYLVDAAIVNSYILYKETLKRQNPKSKPMTALKFRSELANELIASFIQRKKSGPTQTTSNLRVSSHLPIRGTYRRCVLCSSEKKKKKRSNTICQTCKVALCKDCFAPYHSQ